MFTLKFCSSTDFGLGGAPNVSHAHSTDAGASSDVVERTEPSTAVVAALEKLSKYE